MNARKIGQMQPLHLNFKANWTEQTITQEDKDMSVLLEILTDVKKEEKRLWL